MECFDFYFVPRESSFASSVLFQYLLFSLSCFSFLFFSLLYSSIVMVRTGFGKFSEVLEIESAIF